MQESSYLFWFVYSEGDFQYRIFLGLRVKKFLWDIRDLEGMVWILEFGKIEIFGRNLIFNNLFCFII